MGKEGEKMIKTIFIILTIIIVLFIAVLLVCCAKVAGEHDNTRKEN